jgi:hypothetical protein
LTSKAVEIEAYDISKGGSDRIQSSSLTVTRRKKIDHAGIEVELETPDRVYRLVFYDIRHWNREKERWEVHNEASQIHIPDSK